jgi:hypothetical protein
MRWQNSYRISLRRHLLRPATGPATPCHPHEREPAEHGPPLAPAAAGVPLRCQPTPSPSPGSSPYPSPIPPTSDWQPRPPDCARAPRPYATLCAQACGQARISCRYWPSRQPRARLTVASLMTFGSGKEPSPGALLKVPGRGAQDTHKRPICAPKCLAREPHTTSTDSALGSPALWSMSRAA